MSSIQRLPTEILSEIFLFCSQKEDGCKPRLVAGVCAQWRRIALSTCLLWSNIYVDEEKINPESLHALLTLQLNRSGQAPLYVEFSYPNQDGHDIAVLDLLLTTTARWESLDLDLTFRQFKRLQSAPCEFPRLKRLVISHAPSLDLGNLSRPLPLLETLVVTWLVAPLPKQLPWNNLTKCTLSHSSSTEVLNILHSSPTILEYSLIECYSLVEGDPRPGRAVITSQLRSLTMSLCSREFSDDFLAHLTLPKLRALVLHNVDGNNIAVRLTALVTGSSGRLANLSLSGVRLSEPELIAILPLLDTLESLEIAWPSDVHTHALMDTLTFRAGFRARDNVLPKLRNLGLVGGLSCQDEDLLSMLRSRMPMLRRVHLYYAGRTFFFDRALDGLRKAGMVVDMRLDGPVDPFAEESDMEE